MGDEVGEGRQSEAGGLIGDPENKMMFQVGICDVLALREKAPAPRVPGPIQLQIKKF